MKLLSLQSSEFIEKNSIVRDFCGASQTLRAQGLWAKSATKPELVAAQILAKWPTERQLFLVYDDHHKLLATAAASLALQDKTQGFVGFFEALDSPEGIKAAQEVLKASEAWLSERGVTKLIGPVNLCTWFPYRFQMDIQLVESFSWEPSNPLFYSKIWEKAGWAQASCYFSEASKLVSQAAQLNQPALEQALKLGFQFRPIDSDPHRFMDSEVSSLHALTLKAFPGNYLFEPLPLELFRELYVPMRHRLTAMRFSWFVLSPEQTPCGFLFAFEENNALVLKTVGVIPEFRGHRLQMALVQKALEQALSEGIQTVVSALVRQGIASDKIPSLFADTGGVLWRHHYMVMEKKL